MFTIFTEALGHGTRNTSKFINLNTLRSVYYVNYTSKKKTKQEYKRDFPGSTVVKNLPASAGDMGWSPGPGGSHMPRSN